MSCALYCIGIISITYLRATSISNVALGMDGGSGASNRRSSDCVDNAPATSGPVQGAPDLARKRATSAQGLDRNPSGRPSLSIPTCLSSSLNLCLTPPSPLYFSLHLSLASHCVAAT